MKVVAVKWHRNISAYRFIVDTWYVWLQEIFCDAVGLSIGGASYLFAFSHYLRTYGKMAFYRPVNDLVKSSHPVSWSRIKILRERAIGLGLKKEAEFIENEWNSLAKITC